MPFYEYKGNRFRIDVEPVSAYREKTGQDELIGYMAVVKRDELMAKHGYVPDGKEVALFKKPEDALKAGQKFIRDNWDKPTRRKHPVGTKVRHNPTSRLGVIIDPFQSVDLASSWVEFEDGKAEQLLDSELAAV